MKQRLFRAIFILLLMPAGLWAQDISFVASGKTSVGVGEQFRIVYELNADGNRFTGPDFGSLRVITGPMTSSSSSIQIVNGQMARSFVQSYTYIVSAGSEGSFVVSPASVFVDGKKITSNAITIKATASSNQSQAGSQGESSANSNSEKQGVSDKDVFVRAILDKSKVNLGEQVIVTYRLYTKIPISNISVTKLSSFPGFWMKNLMDENTGLQQSRQIINGEEYVTADIRKIALFPQKTGKLYIDPMEMECTAQIRTQTDRKRARDPFESFFNDPFFNRNIVNVDRKLVSGSINIEVSPLPSAGKPQFYSGAVGQFSLQSSIDRTEILANEAITLTYTISGIGNIELIDFPGPAFPSSFEAYEPKVNTQVKVTDQGVSGVRKIEYLLIPRQAGNFTIAPVEFSFFDPKKNQYISLLTQEFSLNVGQSADNNNGRTIISGGQESIRILGSDIRYIKTKSVILNKKNDYFFGSVAYVSIMVILFLSFAFALFWFRKHQKLTQNKSLMRNMQATKVSRKRLVKAQTYLKQNNQNEFYTEISQAIWGYLADKFNIPLSAMSIENVRLTLTSLQIENSLIELLINTLDNCEFARFAPGDPGEKMEELYNQGIEVISKIERNQK